MNSPAEPAQPADGTAAPESDPSSLGFPGDVGELRHETRRVLVQLLLGPAIDASRQTKLWPVLLRDETILRSRLHDLFLELVVDHEQGVAFTRQVVAEGLDVPILLRRSTLTFIQSALFLYLREQILLAEARGERAVVSRADMIDHLSVFESASSRDPVKFGKRAASAVERAKELSLIRKLRGGEERFEVSPTLKLLFSAEEIATLTRTYERLREDGSMADIDEPNEEDEA